MKIAPKHRPIKNEDMTPEELEQLVYIINSVGGKDPSPESKAIIHLYAIGEIDFETAESILLKI